MHPRRVKKLEVNGKTHWLRLGPHLENNKLSLEIIIYYDSVAHMLSSFGLSCDQKAIYEYNNVSITSPDKKSHVSLGEILFSGNMSYQPTVYFCRCAVCPISQSTIMFLMKRNVGWSTIELRAYSFESDEWHSNNCTKHYSEFEEARTILLFFYQLALTYGKDWYQHHKEYMIPAHPEIIEESFEGNIQTIRIKNRGWMEKLIDESNGRLKT